MHKLFVTYLNRLLAKSIWEDLTEQTYIEAEHEIRIEDQKH